MILHARPLFFSFVSQDQPHLELMSVDAHARNFMLQVSLVSLKGWNNLTHTHTHTLLKILSLFSFKLKHAIIKT